MSKTKLKVVPKKSSAAEVKKPSKQQTAGKVETSSELMAAEKASQSQAPLPTTPASPTLNELKNTGSEASSSLESGAAEKKSAKKMVNQEPAWR